MSDKICKIDSCARQVNARGWCSMHYSRWFNTGTTERVCLGCGAVVKDGHTRYVIRNYDVLRCATTSMEA